AVAAVRRPAELPRDLRDPAVRDGAAHLADLDARLGDQRGDSRDAGRAVAQPLVPRARAVPRPAARAVGDASRRHGRDLALALPRRVRGREPDPGAARPLPGEAQLAWRPEDRALGRDRRERLARLPLLD